MTNMLFDDFKSSLSNLHKIIPREDAGVLESISTIVQELKKNNTYSRDSLAAFIKAHPTAVPIIASCAGLGQEQLKNQMKLKLDTTGWVSLARTKPDKLIAFLDEEFNIVVQVNKELAKNWTFEDILLERQLWSKSSGASSVGRGKKVEDEVELIVKQLGLPYMMRTRFGSRGTETAPCDLAIPAGGDEAKIVVGMKGFNSTGSKLSDAVGEIEKMASARLPRQYVYAVIDGIGWLSRQADLKRIFALWENKQIDGLYTLQHLDNFRDDLLDAVQRLNITAQI